MRIIVAVDPAADSDWAEETLRVFPLIDPLDVVLVCALDIPRPPLTSPGRTARGLYGGAIATLRAQAQRAAEQVAESLKIRLTTRVTSVTARIVKGRPALAILQAATSWKADIILTGSSGQNAVSRAILGSVSDEVVWRAPCPVLVVKRRIASFQRVLAATDGSLHAEAALRFLARLPLPTATEIRVCVVSEAPPFTLLSGPGQRQGTELISAMEKQTVLQSIAKAQGLMAALSCRIQSSLRIGNPAHELADEVNRWVPDLLVMGARGRTSGPDTALGSVAEAVLRATRCPTLVARA
jgi:nucleotide-binding universal stress UspA family protein